MIYTTFDFIIILAQKCSNKEKDRQNSINR